jgi:hypothetical protein
MPDEARQPPHFALCPCTKRLLLYSGSALRGALTFQPYEYKSNKIQDTGRLACVYG